MIKEDHIFDYDKKNIIMGTQVLIVYFNGCLMPVHHW
jgi:hypothetical protein